MSSEFIRNKWFKNLSKAALLISIPAYYVAVFANRELGFLSAVEVPLLSAAAFIMLATLDYLQGQVDQTNANFVRLQKSLDETARDISTRLPGEVRVYRHHADFYTALTAAVSGAEHEVWTSYFRRYPPDTLGEASSNYFNTCKSWAISNRKDHHFRRLVVDPQEPPLREWLKEAERPAIDSNYRVRIVPWALHETDSLSIAIIDSRWVFVAFSAEEDRLTGYSFRNPNIIEGYLDYYQRIWDHSKPLDEYFRTTDTDGSMPPTGNKCRVDSESDAP
jgi:hypothetical protein